LLPPPRSPPSEFATLADSLSSRPLEVAAALLPFGLLGLLIATQAARHSLARPRARGHGRLTDPPPTPPPPPAHRRDHGSGAPFPELWPRAKRLSKTLSSLRYLLPSLHADGAAPTLVLLHAQAQAPAAESGGATGSRLPAAGEAFTAAEAAAAREEALARREAAEAKEVARAARRSQRRSEAEAAKQAAEAARAAQVAAFVSREGKLRRGPGVAARRSGDTPRSTAEILQRRMSGNVSPLPTPPGSRTASPAPVDVAGLRAGIAMGWRHGTTFATGSATWDDGEPQSGSSSNQTSVPKHRVGLSSKAAAELE